MLTRRQARLLGLTSGEDDSVSWRSVTAPPPSAADVAYRSSRDSGSAACRARSSERLHDEVSKSPLTVRSSTTGTPSCSAPTSTSGCRANPLLVYLASSMASVPHGNGSDPSSCKACSSSSPVRLEDRQVEILLSKAQATINYWAALSTTGGPLIRLASDSASRSGSRVTRFTRRAASMRRSTNTFPTSMAGDRCPGRAARLTAAQLRTRWRGVTRDCSCIQASTRNTPGESGGPHASARGMFSARKVGLPATVSPTSWSPRAVLGVQGQTGVVMCGGDIDVGAQLATRVTKPGDMTPHHRRTLSTSPPYADVCSPPMVSRAAVVVDTTQAPTGALSIACHMPTTRISTTAFTLRHWKERIYAQRQLRLCLEVHYQAHIRAREARMRLLFAHSDTNGCSNAIKSLDVFAQGRSATALTSLKSVHGEDTMSSDADVYLRSLDSTKSGEEARVLRATASIEAALRRHVALAYTHTPRPVFSLQGTSSDGNARAADDGADEHSESFFTAYRCAILEATIADATRSVEAFTRQLLPYQQEGVQWLLRLNVVEHMNGILADDKGLGKRAQAIVYLSCYKDLVEEVVQRPLEELQQRQAYLCQEALGPTAVATGGSAVARGVDGIEGLHVPRWLTWCTEVAAGAEKTLGGAQRDRQHDSSNVKLSATPFPCDELDASGRPLSATATGLCGGYIQLVKEVKQWLWRLERGTREGGVEATSGGDFYHVPYHSTMGRKRRKRDSDEGRANGDMREVQTLSVAAVPPLKRRRGRPRKRLSAMFPAATAVGPSAPIEVASADIESAVASQTHVPAFSLRLNRQLGRALRAFRPVLIIAPLCTLSHWSGEFQRFSRRDGDAAEPLRPCGSSAAERFTVYVLNGSNSEQESRTREFLTHVERLGHHSSTEGDVVCDPLLPLAGGSAAKPTTPVLIIPHELLVKPFCGALCCVRRIEWHVVVIDVTQPIKSTGGALFHEVCELRCVSRLVLTDTPLQKNATELYSLIRLSAPQTFVSSQLFEQLDSAFLAANGPSGLEDRGFHTLLCRYLHRILVPFLLRREREILKTVLPPMRDFVVLCPLLPLQNARTGEVERGHLAGSPLGSLHMLYRNVLLHPCTTQAFYNVNEEVLRASGKLLVLDFMMCFLKHTQHKFIVFCRCTVMLDVVETLCNMRGIPSVRLDDMTTVERREANSQSRRRPTAVTSKDAAEKTCGGNVVVEDGASFSPSRHWSSLRDSANSLGDPLRGMGKEGRVCDDAALDSALTCCILISKDGADVGLSLQAADTIFFLDVDHHPQRGVQTVSRLYRVGQKNEVRIFRLVTDHPIAHGFASLHEAEDTRMRAVVQAGDRDLCSSMHEREAPPHGIFRAAALSHLSPQWAAVTAPSAGDGQVDIGEIEGEEESVSAPVPPFLCMPFSRHPLRVEADAAGEVEEIKGTLPSRGSKLSRGLKAGEVVKSKIGDGEESIQVHTDHSRVFQVANGGADLHCAALTLKLESSSLLPSPPASSFCFSSHLSISPDTTKGAGRMNSFMKFSVPHRRRHRHISFKLDISDSEGGDIKASSSGAAVNSVAGTMEPLLCSTTPPHPGTKAAVRDVAADASARVLEPAEHLLAMRDRFEEVLPRHDGERRVLDQMFRLLESSFRSGVCVVTP